MTTQITSPVKAIREKCKDCVCDQMKEIELCPVTDCALYPFRFGKNPYNKKSYTPEQRAAMSERLKSVNLAKKSRQDVVRKNL